MIESATYPRCANWVASLTKGAWVLSPAAKAPPWTQIIAGRLVSRVARRRVDVGLEVDGGARQVGRVAVDDVARDRHAGEDLVAVAQRRVAGRRRHRARRQHRGAHGREHAARRPSPRPSPRPSAHVAAPPRGGRASQHGVRPKDAVRGRRSVDHAGPDRHVHRPADGCAARRPRSTPAPRCRARWGSPRPVRGDREAELMLTRARARWYGWAHARPPDHRGAPPGRRGNGLGGVLPVPAAGRGRRRATTRSPFRRPLSAAACGTRPMPKPTTAQLKLIAAFKIRAIWGTYAARHIAPVRLRHVRPGYRARARCAPCASAPGATTRRRDGSASPTSRAATGSACWSLGCRATPCPRRPRSRHRPRPRRSRRPHSSPPGSPPPAQRGLPTRRASVSSCGSSCGCSSRTSGSDTSHLDGTRGTRCRPGRADPTRLGGDESSCSR